MKTRFKTIILATWAVAATSPGALAIDPDSGADRILKKEVIVRASLDDVWRAWTTPEGIAQFFSPESKIELKIGGAYDLYFSGEKDKNGRRGAEGARILSFIPREMLAFDWGFPPDVPSLRYSDAKTQVVLRFADLGDGRVKIKFAQLGWKDGAEWDQGHAYFDRAWDHVLESLKKHFDDAAESKEIRPTNVVVIVGDGPKRVAGKPPTEQAGFDEHAAFMRRLLATGQALCLGPFTDWTGGIVVLKTASVDEAGRIMKDEPFLKGGIATFEFHPWMAIPPWPGGATRTWTDGHVTVTSETGPLKRSIFEIEAPAPVGDVWKLLATAEGFKQLGAKEPAVELRPGGAYSFWPGAPNKVLAFVPYEMLSTSGSAPAEFPNVRKGGTWSAYFLEPAGADKTRLRLVCAGWRPGEKEWDAAHDYFLKANPQFLNAVYDVLAQDHADRKDVLRTEGIVDAPVADVWEAFTTSEGIKSWMVPHAEIDLRVGGKMLTHYDPNGAIGDPNTIENTILSYEPRRMLSIKATKPPANFPFKAAIENMWSVIYFEPLAEDRTKIVVVGMGYSQDDDSQKMRAHFDKGNAWTIQKLRERFSKTSSAAGSASDFDSTRPVAASSPGARPSGPMGASGRGLNTNGD